MKLRLIKIFFFLNFIITFEFEFFQNKIANISLLFCIIKIISKIMLSQISHSLSRPNIINWNVFILESNETVFL